MALRGRFMRAMGRIKDVASKEIVLAYKEIAEEVMASKEKATAFGGSRMRAAERWADGFRDVAPPSKEILMAFGEARDVENAWRVWSDTEHGGKSSASIGWVPREEVAEDGDPGAMVLEGAWVPKTLIHRVWALVSSFSLGVFGV